LQQECPIKEFLLVNKIRFVL